MRYISTRGGGQPQNFEQVLLAGLAPDGGLYVPEAFPALDLSALMGKTYLETAVAVLSPFVGGAVPAHDLREIVALSYASFRHPEIAPLHPLDKDLSVLELFHGPTIAFKDVALQLLGRMFAHVLRARGQRITIVGATSGDTGSAAIEGCRHCAQDDVFILHPHGRVSEVQMTSVHASNVFNIALEGTFDDCQARVKEMFTDPVLRSALNLSAVNSINWARIIAQSVYYVYAGLRAGALERPVSFVVPTGNFGNVYAAWCARQMGLPIRTLAIATNRNDILTRFFESGEMAVRPVEATISPSMDIQVSSNIERYLFHVFQGDGLALEEAMRAFKTTGRLALQEDKMNTACRDFRAFRASESDTLEAMAHTHHRYGYTLDPHSAVGMHAARRLLDEGGHGHVIALGCAHPAKFPDAVGQATGQKPALPEHLSDLFQREEKLSIIKNDPVALTAFIRKNAALGSTKA